MDILTAQAWGQGSAMTSHENYSQANAAASLFAVDDLLKSALFKQLPGKHPFLGWLSVLVGMSAVTAAGPKRGD